MRSGEPIIAIERVLLWLTLAANGAATIFLIVVLLRHPSPASFGGGLDRWSYLWVRRWSRLDVPPAALSTEIGSGA